MSSGLDVYLENVAQKRAERSRWLEQNAHVSVSHNEPFPSDVNNQKQVYIRVNQNGVSWGHQRQIDDNISVIYDTKTKTIVRIEQL